MEPWARLLLVLFGAAVGSVVGDRPAHVVFVVVGSLAALAVAEILSLNSRVKAGRSRTVAAGCGRGGGER